MNVLQNGVIQQGNVLAGVIDPHVIDRVSAAADFLGNGAIETNRYETEITDLVRRESVFQQRVNKKSANGHPHRYFEQLAIVAGTATDPRNIAPAPGGSNRVERAAFIKAFTAQSNFSLFDADVTRMQGQFAGLEAKDIEDIVKGILMAEAPLLWFGNDTALDAPTTNQYVGLLTQITTQFVIAPGASIIDAIKSEVATLASNTTYKVKPTAIYLNGQAIDFIDREAKASKIDLGVVQVAGASVKAISTVVGDLPLINEVFLSPMTGAQFGFGAPPAGTKNYPVVILTEPEVEMPVVHGADGNLNPRLFQLGLVSNLSGQYVGVHFNAIIAKAFAYAHAAGVIQR